MSNSTKTIWVFASCLLGGLACQEPGSSSTSPSTPGGYGGKIQNHRAAIVESDGSVSFYRGKNVAEKLANGEALGQPGSTDGYMRLRVPAGTIGALHGKSTGLLTVSLEESAAPPVAITLYTNALTHEPTDFETLVFKQGDPFITGYAQVIDRGGGVSDGVFQVTRWVHNSLGGWSEQVWEAAGMQADPDAPALKYNIRNPRVWPPLPDNWR